MKNRTEMLTQARHKINRESSEALKGKFKPLFPFGTDDLIKRTEPEIEQQIARMIEDEGDKIKELRDRYIAIIRGNYLPKIPLFYTFLHH